MTLRNKETKCQPHASSIELDHGWFTYIVECGDGSFYTGITQDLSGRWLSHAMGKGAKWTKVRPPIRLRFAERHPDKSAARQRELEIKGWRRKKKLTLIGSKDNLILTTSDSQPANKTQSGGWRFRATQPGWVTGAASVAGGAGATTSSGVGGATPSNSSVSDR